MNYAQIPALISLAAMLVLAGSMLARRHLPAKRLWALVAIWSAIIAFVWAIAIAGLKLGHPHFT